MAKLVTGTTAGGRRIINVDGKTYEDVSEGVWNDVLNATHWTFERPRVVTAYRRYLKDGMRLYANSERLVVAGAGR